jgi:hypothetical protein
MVSEQKFTEVIRSIHFDYELDIELTRNYDDIKSSIIVVLSKISPDKYNNPYTIVAYVVKLESGDRFFSSSVIYETPEDALVLDIEEISVDKFLEYINKNKYINYGL